jgi:hypothetical protein
MAQTDMKWPPGGASFSRPTRRISPDRRIPD